MRLLVCYTQNVISLYAPKKKRIVSYLHTEEITDDIPTLRDIFSARKETDNFGRLFHS